MKFKSLAKMRSKTLATVIFVIVLLVAGVYSSGKVEAYTLGQKFNVGNVNGNVAIIDFGAPGYDRDEFSSYNYFGIYTPRNNGWEVPTTVTEYFSSDGVSWYQSSTYDFSQPGSGNAGAMTGGPSKSIHPEIKYVRYIKYVSDQGNSTFNGVYGQISEGPYAYDYTKPTAPVITPSTTSATRNNVTATIGGSTDNGAVKGYEYKLDGATSQDWISGSSLTVVNEGITTISARAVDYNKNYSDVTTVQVKIDRTGPSSPVFTVNPNVAFSNQDVSISMTHGADVVSGTSYSQYRIDGPNTKSWTTYSGSFTVVAEGQSTIYGRSVDNAGNVGSETVIYVRVDKTSPTPPSIKIGN
jgi:hypothetical protein